MTDTPLSVSASSGGYLVHARPGVLDEVGAIVGSLTVGGAVAVVSDLTVRDLYAERVEGSLAGANLRVASLSVDPGERSKSWETAGRVLEWMSEAGIGRDDAVVALGGGVVGDLAGFCAATYMRGLMVAQVPTTLLAQVDSAIGGKTAVDLAGGKNLAGAFWPPAVVVADPECLATLPDTEWRSGLAEVVKSAVLDSDEAVRMLEADAPALAERRSDAVARAVRMAAGHKARVVSDDEREGGSRESLNYGHTLGHAIERVAGYGTVSHGIAVAEGIRFAASLAERLIGSDREWTARQDALLTACGLPRSGCALDPGRVIEAMRADKKSRGGQVRLVLSSAPGMWEVRAVDDATLADAVDAWCRPQEDGRRS
jgi:3-dehydroquinate synthase